MRAFEVVHDRFAENVGFDIHAVAHLAMLERGERKRRGNQCELETIVVDRCNGEADAVDGDRALGGDVVHQLGGRLNR